MIAWFCIASTRKHFSSQTEAVGDQLFMISLICMSPLTHILALSLSIPPQEFNLALKARFTGITSSAGRTFSDVSKVSLSNSPKISFLIESPHFSLIMGDDLRSCERDFGSGIKSERLICVSWSFPWFYMFEFVHGLYSCIQHYSYLQGNFSWW